MQIISKFKWTIFLVFVLVLFFVFSNSPFVVGLIDYLKSLGGFGAFIVGIFFVSIFTAVPATIALIAFSSVLDPVLVALFAGLGAVFGDYLILRTFKDGFFEEMKLIFKRKNNGGISILPKNKFSRITLSILGAFIIISPFPDEVGIVLMGLTNIKKWQFIAVSFILNTIGIFFIVKAGVVVGV